MRKRKARTERRTKKTGAASVALATFCVVGGIGGIGGIGEITGETAAQAGGVRVAFAGEDSAEERRWRKAANQGKTPWKTEEGDAAFLPPRPQPEFAPPPPKSDAKPSVSLDGVRKGAEILFWALVGAAVVALAVAMWQTWRRTREAGGKDKSKKARQDRERRLEAIAPEARERVDDLGTAAENALAAGDLRLALVYFFSWLIVEADKRGLLRAQRGKTNREYWLELAVNPGVRTIYKATMDEFERVYFGGQAISQAEFDDVWRLREPFAATMARLDAGRAAAERASQEAARRAPNAQVAARWAGPAGPSNAGGSLGVGGGAGNAQVAARWAGPAGPSNAGGSLGVGGGAGNAVSRIWALPLAAAVALGAVASSGCAPKKEYWDEYWSDVYASSNGGNESINGVSIFANYCAKKTRGVEQKGVDDFEIFEGDVAVDGERYETIVWFSRAFGVVEADDARIETAVELSATDGSDAELDSDFDPDFGSEFDFDFDPDLGSELDSDFEPGFGSELDSDFDPDFESELGFEPGFGSELDSDSDFDPGFESELDSDFDFETLFKFEMESATETEEEESATASVEERDSPKYVPLCDLAFREARPAIERWLREKPNRTFVFVPSGWTADADYWRAVQEKAPAEHADWAAERLREAEEARGMKYAKSEPLDELENNETEATRRQNEEEGRNEEFWATWRGLDEGKRRERFSGVDAWTAGLPETFEVWTSRTLTPDVANGTEVLLSVDGDPFVCRRRVGESDFFALESASFLLNFALTKPENRVLAGRLADEFNPKGRTLVWCGDRLKFATDAEKESIEPFSLARLTSFSLAVLHLAALTALFVAWRFPILGRPKRNAREATNDYSKHVDGVAFLLERAGARDWAQRELETFRAAREAGAAFREPNVDAQNDGGAKAEMEAERPPEESWRGKNAVRSERGASRKFFRR